ncbi:MAG: DUF3078 domain-containing protein [Chitinophagaceae bacterium]|nr:DUF3078 domain-containing protein [Chitinophagaceae bacterium]
MKKTTIFFIAVLLSVITKAQDASLKTLQAESFKTVKNVIVDTIHKYWKRGGIYNLNLAQGSLSNWAAGGDEFSFSVNSQLSLYAFFKKDNHSWDNSFDFNIGYINTTSLGGRKNDDRFDLLSKYGCALNPKLNLTTLFNLHSQFFKGYTYQDTVRTLSSNFMAPGYVLLSLGLDYKPTKNLSIFVSPATSRLVIVKDSSLANKGLYGVTPGKKSNFEFGAFATINYRKEINKHITYKGRLDLYSNYKHNPHNVDLFMSNMLNAKISRLFSVSWGVDLIYDDDVRLFGKNGRSAALQVKSLVGIGLLVKF